MHHFTQVGLLSSPLTDNKMKVHTGEVTCPKSPNQYTAKLRFEPKCLLSKGHVFITQAALKSTRKREISTLIHHSKITSVLSFQASLQKCLWCLF